jgi:hypothetical protein
MYALFKLRCLFGPLIFLAPSLHDLSLIPLGIVYVFIVLLSRFIGCVLLLLSCFFLGWQQLFKSLPPPELLMRSLAASHRQAQKLPCMQVHPCAAPGAAQQGRLAAGGAKTLRFGGSLLTD